MTSFQLSLRRLTRKFGADLGEPDKVWVDQQRALILDDGEMAAVAINNDRSQFELVLDDRIKELLLSAPDKIAIAPAVAVG